MDYHRLVLDRERDRKRRYRERRRDRLRSKTLRIEGPDTATCYLFAHQEIVAALEASHCPWKNPYRVWQRLVQFSSKEIEEFRRLAYRNYRAYVQTIRNHFTYYHKVQEDDESEIQYESESEELPRTIGKRKTKTRFMRTFTQNELPQPLKTKLTAVDEHCKMYYDRTPQDWSILWSTADCRLQLPHRDFFLEDIERQVRDNHQEEYPFVGILSLADGGNLAIWKDITTLDEIEVVKIDAGDLLIFRGNIVHAGGCYPCGHFARLHFFLPSNSVLKRDGENDWIKTISRQQLNKLHALVERSLKV